MEEWKSRLGGILDSFHAICMTPPKHTQQLHKEITDSLQEEMRRNEEELKKIVGKI
jgi:hypothetical protein